MSADLQITSIGDSGLPALVLVHGWGHNADVWEPLIDRLEGRFQIHLLTLPGYGSDPASLSESWQLDSLLEGFKGLAIPAAVWCGWSLGGMLATLFAARYPERVTSLVTMASNAHFVRHDGWPHAMPEAEAKQFSDSVKANAQATLKRFLALICQGSETAKEDLRFLRGCKGTATTETLVESLALLYNLDVRESLSTLSMPQHHLLGEHDALVPLSVEASLKQLNTNASVTVIKGASHAPLVSHSQTVAGILMQQVTA